MEITCDSCQTKLKIADDKIPLDRTSTFACPKCKGKVTIKPEKPESPEKADTSANADPAAGEGASPFADLGFDEESLDSGEGKADTRPFQFIEEEGKVALVCESDPVIRKIVQLQQLGAIGPVSAWVFIMELFDWRTFNNRRELASLVGLTPMP